MRFDPYEELGLERDADQVEIEKAARQHAKKSHPDAGGDDEAFQRGRRALAVLSDPEKRERFDRTGDAEEASPDNTLAMAMQIIEAKIATATNDYLMNSLVDPRKIDLIKKIKHEINSDIQQAQEAKRGGEKHLKFLADMAKRFSRKNKAEGFDFIARRFADEIAAVNTKLRMVDDQIRGCKMAADLIDGYDFKADPVSQYAAPTSGMFTTYFTGT